LQKDIGNYKYGMT